MRAITGTYEEIAQAYEGLVGKIQRDGDGIEVVQVFDAGNGLQTLVWQPIAKKARKQPSMKAMNEVANIHYLEVQPCDGGFEIVNARGSRQAFAPTKRGIQRKLTKVVQEKLWAAAQRLMG